MKFKAGAAGVIAIVWLLASAGAYYLGSLWMLLTR